MGKIKILFFTPFGGYTGSEMMLWYLLSNLSKEKFEIKLYSLQKGALFSQFPDHIEVQYANQNKNSFLYRVKNGLRKKLNLLSIDESQILKMHHSFKPDYWYLNTMVMPSISELADKNRIKYIVHFHELLSQYSNVSALSLSKLIKNAFYTVGCSENVCENLRNLGAKNVFKQYECVDFERVKADDEFAKRLKLKHGIEKNAFVILMSGHRIERKGFDLFVETAIRSKEKYYHFIWLGESVETGYDYFMEQRIKNSGVKNITIIKTLPVEYFQYLNIADLFFLTSREDPFPLVMLEAAYLKKPILAFNSGGSTEFVTEKTGKVLTEWSNETIDQAIEEFEKEIKTNKYNPEDIRNRALQYDVKIQTGLFENWLCETCKSNK